MKKIIKIFVLASIFFTAACGSSTKLVSSWKNKEIASNHYEKIAVVAITPNSSGRYLIERAVADDMKSKGLKAIPTYEIFPFAGKVGELLSKSENPEAIKERIKNKVKENNIDAIMIIGVMDTQKEQRYVPDRTNNYYYPGGTGYYGVPQVVPGAAAMPFTYGAYYNYYAYNMSNYYTSGYYVEDVTYFLESNLYDVKKEQLLWTGRTKSMNIKSVEEEAPKFAALIINDIMAKKVLEP